MKFSYRLVALILLVVVLMGFFMTWGNSALWSSWPIKRSRLINSHLWPLRDTQENDDSPPKRILPQPPAYEESECEFAHLDDAKADIRTIDFLAKINENLKTSPQDKGQLREDGMHVPLPMNEKTSTQSTMDENYFSVKKKKKGPLKIILVPHSHNDPGWTKTLQGYFDDQTKPTLDFMVEKLVKYPKMSFIWAESIFLQLWWAETDSSQRAAVERLIKNGQLEIVVGSWVVPDEANPSYFALIDQMIEGHQWLELNMGVKPNNTWSLDPFGYSSTLPYLYKKAGYENMVILRVHEMMKNELQKHRALEFHWRQHWDRSSKSDMFTQMMPYKLYNIKHTCGPDHYICLQFDFRKIPGEMSESRAETITTFNMERQAKILLGQYQKKASLFRHNVVLVPLGDDFRYDRNIEWDQQYKNYQMLFNYMNNKPEWNVQAKFGTIQDYFNEVHKDLDPTDFPVLEGDFFPYTDTNNEYWTGYYSSRPFDKMIGRELEQQLRAADIIQSLAIAAAAQRGAEFKAYQQNMDDLQEAHRSLGLFQHHDAITGTARSFVAIDYEDRVLKGIDSAQFVTQRSAEFLLEQKQGHSTFKLEMDDSPSLKLIASEKKALYIGGDGANIVIYNPIAQKRRQIVRVLVTADKVGVLDPEGNIITSQINPVWLKEDGSISEVHFELLFMAELSALGLKTYKIRPVQTLEGSGNFAAFVRLYNVQNYKVPRNIRFSVYPPGSELIVLENDAYRVRFSPRTGLMHSITTKSKIMTTRINLQFLMYKSRGSGAYIFYPAGPAVDNELSSRPVVRVIKGPLVSEIHVLQNLVHHTVRVYNITGPMTSAIEIENIVDIRQMDNKEIIMRLSSDITDHNNTFYTDLNGLYMTKRKKFSHFPAQASYYPMTSMMYLEDGYSRLSVLSAQPLGVSSLEPPGNLEVMLDRRLMFDDGRGLGEGILDNKETPSRFYVVLERKDKHFIPLKDDRLTSHPSLLANTLSNHLNHPVLTIFIRNQSDTSLKVYEPISKPLPCDIRLVDLRPLERPESLAPKSVAAILHRVGFQCDYPSGGMLCQTNTGKFSLSSLLGESSSKVKKVTENTLSLMHEKRLVNVLDEIHLDPMELYTYKITFQS